MSVQSSAKFSGLAVRDPFACHFLRVSFGAVSRADAPLSHMTAIVASAGPLCSCKQSLILAFTPRSLVHLVELMNWIPSHRAGLYQYTLSLELPSCNLFCCCSQLFSWLYRVVVRNYSASILADFKQWTGGNFNSCHLVQLVLFEILTKPTSIWPDLPHTKSRILRQYLVPCQSNFKRKG